MAPKKVGDTKLEMGDVNKEKKRYDGQRGKETVVQQEHTSTNCKYSVFTMQSAVGLSKGYASITGIVNTRSFWISSSPTAAE